MVIREIVSEFNIIEQAKKYGIPWWQHPQFLFLVLGSIIAFSSILSYVLGRRYIEDPQVVALLIIIFTGISLVVSFLITRSFERLAQAARIKSEFVSIVSHQLRSPLSNLVWGLEFLMSGRAGEVKEAQLEYFQILKENSSRMQELVNDLLVVSRIDEGSLPWEQQEFSFEELLNTVLVEYEPYMKASNIQFQVQGQKDLPRVLGDASQLRHVISNLLENAVRYSGKEHASGVLIQKKENRIQIRYQKKGKNLFFEITDNGVGIPKEDQRYIFQKFFRSSNILRHETQGSGLGLYIAKSIIERGKGSIGFHSQEHAGSTFWFTMPCRTRTQ
ncbi:MAG: HAMP domain-containing sensor histidine kinase [bacterium]|nr:HAMP domain-containing sensor histidine kinase [bacterium]